MDLTLTVFRVLVFTVLHQTSSTLASAVRKCTNDHVPEKVIRDVIANDFMDRALHRSFNLIPPLRNNLKRDSKADQLFRNTKEKRGVYNLFGDKSFPNTTDSKSADVIYRSTCPWYISMDVDDNRLPRVMAFARCKCKHCIGQTGNICMPVYSYPTVLRRICRPEGYQYIPVTEKHPVACTCAVERELSMEIVTKVIKPNGDSN